MKVTTDEIQRTQDALFKAHGIEMVRLATMMRSMTVAGFDANTTHELQEVFAGCVRAKLREMGKTTQHLRAAVNGISLAAQAFESIQAIPDDSDVLAAMLTQ